MFVFLLVSVFACFGEPEERVEAVDRPTIVVVGPMTGGNAALGAALVQGVTLALGETYAVRPVDEARGDPINQAASIQPLVGVIAHATPTAADRFAPRWKESELPVIMATSNVDPELPSILPDSATHARCASAFVPTNQWLFLANDGTPEGIAATESLEDHVNQRKLLETRTVDPRQIGREAERVKGTYAQALVYAGEPTTGGNFLHTLRNGGSKIDFVGVGLYDRAFLTAAGSSSHGVVVTSPDRPGLVAEIRTAYQERFGAAPSAAALNAYDAAQVLRGAYELARNQGDQNLMQGTRLRIGIVEATGVAGPLKIGKKGSPEPDYCSAFAVKSEAFHYRGVARFKDGEVEIVHKPGMKKPE